MLIVKFEEIEPCEWDKACQKVTGISIRHASFFIEYWSKSYDVEQHSVIVYDDQNQLVAVCPLFVESRHIQNVTYRSLSMSIPRAAISVATNTRIIPDLNSLSAFWR